MIKWHPFKIFGGSSFLGGCFVTRCLSEVIKHHDDNFCCSTNAPWVCIQSEQPLTWTTEKFDLLINVHKHAYRFEKLEALTGMNYH